MRPKALSSRGQAAGTPRRPERPQATTAREVAAGCRRRRQTARAVATGQGTQRRSRGHLVTGCRQRSRPADAGTEPAGQVLAEPTAENQQGSSGSQTPHRAQEGLGTSGRTVRQPARRRARSAAGQQAGQTQTGGPASGSTSRQRPVGSTRYRPTASSWRPVYDGPPTRGPELAAGRPPSGNDQAITTSGPDRERNEDPTGTKKKNITTTPGGLQLQATAAVKEALDGTAAEPPR